MSKIAYADPPYMGCAHRYPEKKEVDYETLIAELTRYDAWALSCHTPSLRLLLPMTPDGTRVAAWVKPWCVFRPNVNPAYAWESVLYVPLPRPRMVRTVRDWVSANITTKKGVVGAKPPEFCFWLFDLLGAKPEDDFYDLFLGTGIVSQCWKSWVESKEECQQPT